MEEQNRDVPVEFVLGIAVGQQEVDAVKHAIESGFDGSSYGRMAAVAAGDVRVPTGLFGRVGVPERRRDSRLVLRQPDELDPALDLRDGRCLHSGSNDLVDDAHSTEELQASRMNGDGLRPGRGLGQQIDDPNRDSSPGQLCGHHEPDRTRADHENRIAHASLIGRDRECLDVPQPVRLARYFRASATSASKSRLSSSSSGCQRTPTAKRCAGSSIASIDPSSAQPTTSRSSPT